ncbi:uncharacterized protein LOC144145626 isoform X2 [Haemaphysalis longicornis]
MVAASAKSCFRVESGSLCGLANSGHQPNAGHYDVPPAKPVELGADTVRLLAAARAIRGFAGVVDNVPCLEEVEQHSPPMSQQVNCQLHNSEAARNGPGAALPREGACSEARHLIAGPGKVS